MLWCLRGLKCTLVLLRLLLLFAVSALAGNVWSQTEPLSSAELSARYSVAASNMPISLHSTDKRTRLSVHNVTEALPKVTLLQYPPRLLLELPDPQKLYAPEKMALEALPLIGSPINALTAFHTGSVLHLTLKLKEGQENKVDIVVRDESPARDQALSGMPRDEQASKRYFVDLYHEVELTDAPLRDDSQLAVAAASLLIEHAPAAGGEITDTAMGESIYPVTERVEKDIDWVISGTWQQELSEERHRTQKFESLIQPRVDMNLSDSVSLSAQVRLRYDSEAWMGPEAAKADSYSRVNGPWYNTAHAELSLREFYLDSEWWGSYWRLGKQQVVWGQADGLKVLDVINPQSFREFIVDDFDDSRIPLWMLNVEMPLAMDASLQLLWVPDNSYHEWAEEGSSWQLTSPALSPLLLPGFTIDWQAVDKPSAPLKDSDVGVRYSDFIGGWDITLNYLYHYQDAPVYYQSLDALTATQRIRPRYERNHLVGSTLSNAFASFTLRAELAYSSDTFHNSLDFTQQAITRSPELASVLGLDWQGPNTVFVSGQWFQSHLLDYRTEVLREQTEHTLSLLYQQDFSNETWQLKLLALHSLNHHDKWLQLKLKYFMQSNLELWFSSDRFSGESVSLFGQFDDRDRFSIGFELGF